MYHLQGITQYNVGQLGKICTQSYCCVSSQNKLKLMCGCGCGDQFIAQEGVAHVATVQMTDATKSWFQKFLQ